MQIIVIDEVEANNKYRRRKAPLETSSAYGFFCLSSLAASIMSKSTCRIGSKRLIKTIEIARARCECAYRAAGGNDLQIAPVGTGAFFLPSSDPASP